MVGGGAWRATAGWRCNGGGGDGSGDKMVFLISVPFRRLTDAKPHDEEETCAASQRNKEVIEIAVVDLALRRDEGVRGWQHQQVATCARGDGSGLNQLRVEQSQKFTFL